ncbi:hypothetical protein JCM16814_08970 [Desulfobaculum senezii]
MGEERRHDAQGGAGAAPGAAAEVMQLFGQYLHVQARNRRIKRLTGVLVLGLFVVYGSLIAGLFTQFNQEEFVAALRGEVLALRPQAEVMLRDVIEENREETLRRVDKAVQRNAPLVAEALDREISRLAEEASVVMYNRVNGFVKRQFDTHGAALFGQYPELADPEYRADVEEHILAVLDRTVARVMDDELRGIETSLEGMEKLLAMPEVRARVTLMRDDPAHSSRFIQAFMALMAGPYAR